MSSEEVSGDPQPRLLSITDVKAASDELDYVLYIGVHNCETLCEKYKMVRAALKKAEEANISSVCDAPYNHEPDGCLGVGSIMRLAASRYREAVSLFYDDILGD